MNLAIDMDLAAIAGRLRAGDDLGAVLRCERLARDVAEPGLRALLLDLAVRLDPGPRAKRNDERGEGA